MTTNFGVANDFNAFILGDATFGSVGPYGKVGIMGNTFLRLVNIGDHILPIPPYGTVDTLIVSGNLTWDSGINVSGNTVVYPGSTYNATSVVYGNADPALQPVRSTPVDFIVEKAYLQCASNSWSNLPPTPGTSLQLNGTVLEITAPDPTFNIVEFDGSNILGSGLTLETITEILVISPEFTTILFNVGGVNLGLGPYNFSHAGEPPGVTEDWRYWVWNFYEAQTIYSTDTAINGTILAPLADWTCQGNGSQNGIFISKSIVSDALPHAIRLELYGFSGNLPEVCGAPPATECCSMYLDNVQVDLTGEGAVINVGGTLTGVRLCNADDYVALGLSVYDTSTGVNVPLGREFLNVGLVLPPGQPFIPGCYDLPFSAKFIYVGPMCPTEPTIGVNALANYVCSSIDF